MSCTAVTYKVRIRNRIFGLGPRKDTCEGGKSVYILKQDISVNNSMYLSPLFLIFFHVTRRPLLLFFHVKRIITVPHKDMEPAHVSPHDSSNRIPKESQLLKCNLYLESYLKSLTQN